MSATTQRVLERVRRMIPPLLDKFHKGQLGRVGVIGGSIDYTGAPFFSAMASARLGCDMSHIICTPGAGAVIKTYSPNLMVHPLMRESGQEGQQEGQQEGPGEDPNEDPDEAERIAASVIAMLPRLHVLVVGPGLGRDKLMQATAARVVSAAREKDMPVVLDADALLLVQHRPQLVRGYAAAVLTPNVVEFGRLWDALAPRDAEATTSSERVEVLAKALGGVTIVQKGAVDVISNGRITLADDVEGGRKRSAGQGDTLTGTIATFLGWREAYLDGIWDGDDKENRLSEGETLGLAAFGGSAVTRESSRLAFIKRGRSLQASDLTDEVHNAFMALFGDIDGDLDACKL
ncbi:ATP-dependent (S)-NAD(P)H-hydrate dehydratase [Ophiocordyceps camponoti-floridani]|uniref:ATP-dependent (S)-NAD(P)H-hydrate dehydratase n=1 Tax=Ophiocordyceps camponoti-floridani TaxID=2030778 RepID=A0A8H4VAW6_9HYPO|nr:ATP-dependent (S)-NAD(P)H-hydrate dehydratase [Ophiocordyceps camponoti-floridani]